MWYVCICVSICVCHSCIIVLVNMFTIFSCMQDNTLENSSSAVEEKVSLCVCVCVCVCVCACVCVCVCVGGCCVYHTVE